MIKSNKGLFWRSVLKIIFTNSYEIVRIYKRNGYRVFSIFFFFFFRGLLKELINQKKEKPQVDGRIDDIFKLI